MLLYCYQDKEQHRNKGEKTMENKTSGDIIRGLMKEAGLTQEQLAKLVGMRRQSNVSEALIRDMKYSIFVKMANSMGYEVIIRKNKPGRKES